MNGCGAHACVRASKARACVVVVGGTGSLSGCFQAAAPEEKRFREAPRPNRCGFAKRRARRDAVSSGFGVSERAPGAGGGPGGPEAAAAGPVPRRGADTCGGGRL